MLPPTAPAASTASDGPDLRGATPEAALPPARTVLSHRVLADDLTRSSLQLIVDGVTELAHVPAAWLAVAEGGRLTTVVCAGDGCCTPAGSAPLPIEALDVDGLPGDARLRTVIGDDGRTHLAAALRDASGGVRGALVLSLDGAGQESDDGLEEFAALAERTLRGAVARADLEHQVEVAAAARSVIRAAARDVAPANIIARSGPVMAEAFDLVGIWLLLYEEAPDTPVGTYAAPGRTLTWNPAIGPAAQETAAVLWERGEVSVLGPDQAVNVHLSDHLVDLILADHRTGGLSSSVHVPLGAGDQLLGSLLLLRAAPVPWTAAEIDAAATLGSDLGSVVASGRELRRQRALAEELRAVDRRRSRLITTLAHELKNPLTAVLTNLELVVEGDLDPLATEQACAAMRHGTSRIRAMASELRELAVVARQAEELAGESVDLVSVVRGLAVLAGSLATAAGVTVTTDLPDSPVLTRGDAAALDRAVGNLVGNAVKYTPPGGSVSVSVSASDDTAEIVVADTGIGIRPQELERLFEEFFRGEDPAARTQPGSGLGLAIADRVVRMHGGRISVESEHGVGSTFRVLLPRGSA